MTTLPPKTDAPKKAPPTKKGATLAETSLAAALGITRPGLRGLRIKNLTEGTDWHRQKREVFYTVDAVEKIRRICELPPEALAAILRSAEEADEIWTLKVRRVLQSRFTLEAHWPDEDPHQAASDILRVNVKDSRKFTVGMALQCRHLQDDLYECTQQTPRWRGHW